MAHQGKQKGRPGDDRQASQQGGVAGQHSGDTGRTRPQNRAGQNQSAEADDEGGQPGQDHDLAGMRGQQAFRGGQQGQPDERGQGDGERGGSR